MKRRTSLAASAVGKGLNTSAGNFTFFGYVATTHARALAHRGFEDETVPEVLLRHVTLKDAGELL